jgi:hypothetical protein
MVFVHHVQYDSNGECVPLHTIWFLCTISHPLKMVQYHHLHSYGVSAPWSTWFTWWVCTITHHLVSVHHISTTVSGAVSPSPFIWCFYTTIVCVCPLIQSGFWPPHPWWDPLKWYGLDIWFMSTISLLLFMVRYYHLYVQSLLTANINMVFHHHLSYQHYGMHHNCDSAKSPYSWLWTVLSWNTWTQLRVKLCTLGRHSMWCLPPCVGVPKWLNMSRSRRCAELIEIVQ